MGRFGAYDVYGDIVDDEVRLDELRAKHDALTRQELQEKLALFQRLSTTGRVYSDIHITNTTMPERPAPADSPDQRQAEARFGELRERPFALSAQEQRELRQLYLRFGTQPERYTHTGVTLHVGR
jgi:hypothetical protein